MQQPNMDNKESRKKFKEYKYNRNGKKCELMSRTAMN